MSVTQYRCRDGRLVWRARLWIDGKHVSLGLFETRAEAKRVVASARKKTAPKHVKTLRWWGEQWLDERELRGVQGASRERSVWDRHVVGFAHFADWPLRKIKRKDVVTWVRRLEKRESVCVKIVDGEKILTPTGRKLSSAVVRNAIKLVRGALTSAADVGLAVAGVADNIRTDAKRLQKKAWTYLTLEEIDRLLALKMRPEQQAIYPLAIYSGMRMGEICGLQWRHVHLTGDRPRVHVLYSRRKPLPKNNQPRDVPLLRPALEALKRWQQVRPGVGHALVFPAHHGGCHAQGFDAGWPSLKRRAEITRHDPLCRECVAGACKIHRVTFHDLRHTCGSHLVSGSWGAPWRLEEVGAMLGHKSSASTQIYAHLAPDALHRLAALTNRFGAEHEISNKR